MIIISPYSRKLRNGERNPKDYPYWEELVAGLKQRGHKIIQLGVAGEPKIEGVDEVCYNLKLKAIKDMLIQSHIWISVDNFLPHLASHTSKPGIVIWGRSNPDIFGYPQNINILSHTKHLRQDQFDIWETIEYNENVFTKPEEILRFI
jgi:ADP-heptose:LPS heptosyltransferase